MRPTRTRLSKNSRTRWAVRPTLSFTRPGTTPGATFGHFRYDFLHFLRDSDNTQLLWWHFSPPPSSLSLYIYIYMALGEARRTNLQNVCKYSHSLPRLEFDQTFRGVTVALPQGRARGSVVWDAVKRMTEDKVEG